MGSYWTAVSLRCLYPAFWSAPFFRLPWFTRHRAFVLFATVFEAVLLILDYSHYSVDILVAWILAALVLTSEHALFFIYYANFCSVVPFEDNLYYQRLLLKKILHLRRVSGDCSVGGKEMKNNSFSTDDQPVVFSPWNTEDRKLMWE